MKMLRSQPDDAACRLCIENLENYIASQLAGEDYLSRFTAVATHLDSCPECAGAYARIYDLELAELSNQLPQPSFVPEPDLSFLTPQPTISALNLLQQSIRQWAGGLSLQLTVQLLSLLRPPMPASQLRQASTQDRYGELLLQLPPEAESDSDLPISIIAYKDTHNPDLCLVEVIVQPLGRSWPNLGGSTVVLDVAGAEKTAVTDHDGLAAFTAVPIAALATLGVTIHFSP